MSAATTSRLTVVALVAAGCGDDSDDPLDETSATTAGGKARDEKLSVDSPAPSGEGQRGDSEA